MPRGLAPRIFTFERKSVPNLRIFSIEINLGAGYFSIDNFYSSHLQRDKFSQSVKIGYVFEIKTCIDGIRI